MTTMTGLTPGATIKHITLDDGQQASVVIQGGRITKILAANGQVAELSWKNDAAMDNSWGVSYHKLSPPPHEPDQQYRGDAEAHTPNGMHSEADDGLMHNPVQEAPLHYPSHSQPALYQPEPYLYNHMGSSGAMRVNSPEMPTILETNSQAPSPEGPALMNPSPDHHQQHHQQQQQHHQMQQPQWNPINSWLPPAGPPQSHPSSLTGHYPADRLSSSKQAQLHTAPSTTGGNKRSQSLPYTPVDPRTARGSIGHDPYARRSYVDEGLRHAYSGGVLGPETPSPQEQRTVSRLGYEDSPQLSTPASTASPATPATPGKKKLTVWKRFKNAFTPGKSKSEEKKDAAQMLMQDGPRDTDTQRFSEKHSQQAQQADSVNHYSRTTSFRDAQENQPPQSYRHSVDSIRRPELMPINSRYKASSLYTPTSSNAPVYPRRYRHSIESLHRPELPSNTRPFREANYPQPMHGNPPAPDMLLYPPLEHDNRRASSSNFGYSGRHSLSAHGQRPLGQGNEVQRPDYMQSYAVAEQAPKVSRRSSLSTDYSFAVTDEAMPPPPPSVTSQERLKQQQYLRQQFIQQQQEERQRAAQLPMPAEPGQPEMQMQGQAEMPLQDSWGRPEQKSFDATSARQASGAAPSPDKSQLLHSAPTRAFSLDSTQSPEGAEQRRSRRIRTMDYGKGVPTDAPAMSGMAGRWIKNSYQGSDGSMVDDLLQLSNLQRLARQKIVEMEIIETVEVFEIVWNIPLNNGHSKIKKSDKYLKSSEVCELPRRDGRLGVLRSQINFTPEGHVHIRALQGDPFGAVFHDRIKMSTGGHRLKIEQKFQLLAPGVMPVKHHSIWQRVEEPL